MPSRELLKWGSQMRAVLMISGNCWKSCSNEFLATVVMETINDHLDPLPLVHSMLHCHTLYVKSVTDLARDPVINL